jgi:hypothetical protein
MGKRDVEIDIIGNDRTARATRSAARNLGDVDAATKSLTDRAGKAAAAAARLAAGAARLAASAASAASALVPLAAGTAATAVAAGKAAVAMAPLLSLLLAAAAGAVVLKLAAAAIGPAMLTAMQPVTAAWEGMSARIGAIAAKGLPGLARAFVRVNLPVVERDLGRVAAAANIAAVGYGRWITSAAGVAAMGQITSATADAVAEVAPTVDRLAAALTRLAGRAASPAFELLADTIGHLARQTERWVDSISSEGIDQAMLRAGQAVGGFVDRVRALRDVVSWLADHQDQVRAVSDTLAGVGVVLGILTGNPGAVALGTLTLVGNHLDWIKEKAGALVERWQHIWQAIANDQHVIAIRKALGDIATLIGGDLSDAWDGLQRGLEKVAEWAGKAWDQLGPKLAELLKDPKMVLGLRIIAALLVGVAVALAALTIAAGIAVAGIVGFLGALVAWMVGTFGPMILGVFGRILGAFGTLLHVAAIAAAALGMDGLAVRLLQAEQTVKGFVDRANAALDRLRDRTITIDIHATTSGDAAGIRIARGAFSGFRGGVALAADPGGGRTQPPAVPVVHATTTVLIDGREVRAMARTVVTHEIDRQAWRATTGRR